MGAVGVGGGGVMCLIYRKGTYTDATPVPCRGYSDILTPYQCLSNAMQLQWFPTIINIPNESFSNMLAKVTWVDCFTTTLRNDKTGKYKVMAFIEESLSNVQMLPQLPLLAELMQQSKPCQCTNCIILYLLPF